MFENWTNGFVIRWNLKYNNSLTSKMQHNRNFNIWVNWVKVIACQTGLPKILCKVQIYENNNWPTLRDSKPNQIDSKWLKIWNIGSLVWILDTPKVANNKTFLVARYSDANKAFCRYLTLRWKWRNYNCSKWDFTK